MSRRLTGFLLALTFFGFISPFHAGAGAAGFADEVKELGNGQVRIGKVVLDREARSASFPGRVNMDGGYIEYVLVSERGKTHESLLSTAAQPVNLHTAMLLLGVKGALEPRGEAGADGEKSSAIDAERLQTATPPTGDRVILTVAWTGDDGMPGSVPVEDWVINEERNGPARRCPWIYNGSVIYRGNFVAQSDGSFVALIVDSLALINNPREGNKNDQIWKPNSGAMPPVGTPVTITVSVHSMKEPETYP